MENNKINQTEEIYEIKNKRYKVISKSIENSKNIEEIYDVLCDFIISKLKSKDTLKTGVLKNE